MALADQVQEEAKANLDKKIIISVIAAGVILTGTAFLFRKIGFKKAAAVVTKVK